MSKISIARSVYPFVTVLTIAFCIFGSTDGRAQDSVHVRPPLYWTLGYTQLPAHDDVGTSRGGALALGKELSPSGHWIFAQLCYLIGPAYQSPAYTKEQIQSGHTATFDNIPPQDFREVPHGNQWILSFNYCWAPLKSFMFGPTLGLAHGPVLGYGYIMEGPRRLEGALYESANTRVNIGGALRICDVQHSWFGASFEYGTQTGFGLGLMFPF